MKPFIEAFCEHYGCQPEEFTRKVFFFCAVQKNKTLLKIAWFFETRGVVESKKIIQEVANAKALHQLDDAFFDYRHSLHDMGLANSTYRVSTHSIKEVFKLVQGLELL